MEHNDKNHGFAPLLMRSHIEGWKTLASYFRSIRIDVTGNALQLRRGRCDLPVLGGGARGRTVYFTPPEIDAWVRNLTGHSLKAWIARVRRTRRSGQDAKMVRPRRSPVGCAKHLPGIEIHAITTQHFRWGEQVLRDEPSYMYAARDPAVFEDVVAQGGPEEETLKAWRYFGLRRATLEDLKPPPPRRKRRAKRQAGRLIGGVVRHGTAWRWCHVPGSFFGLSDEVTTPFLASKGLPRWQEAVAWVRADEPNVEFLVWTRRVEVEPVTLEEIPQGGLADVLKEPVA